jgi:serine protease Do
VLVRFRRRDEEILTVIDVSKKEPDAAGGELPKAWIGIRTQVLTPDVARALDLKGKWGFRVTQVFPDTEAARAGLKPGDLIFALNGNFLKASRLSESEMLRRRVEDLTIGAKATLGVFRGGAKTELTVVLEETPTTAAEVKTARSEIMELTVRDITFMDRVANRWDKGQGGVIVVEVTSGGWANLAGLRSGDLVLSVQETAVKDVKHFEEVLEDLKAKKPGTVKFFVKRGPGTAFVFVEPEWDRDEKKD